MKITKISGLGSEITATIRRNSAQSAYDYNVRQSKKYLAGCADMIAYGEHNLSKIMRGTY